jgi:hypothetical protein
MIFSSLIQTSTTIRNKRWFFDRSDDVQYLALFMICIMIRYHISADLVDEGVHIDEIVDDDFLYLPPVDVGAEFVEVYHVLHQ